ncbi:MAG TPA: choice-of-anchor D domain-containing protein [Candidatus Dormibacteraeota bacterium]|nr:choice-of-anchor D domain-containing protein [Candidatus Dormibacteraeota bacterium]
MKTTGGIKQKLLNIAIGATLLFAFGTPAQAKVSTSSSSSLVNFGNQAVGTTSVPQTVTITNTNGNTIQIVGVSSSTTQFSYSGPALPISLNRYESMTATVTFSPTAAQAYSGVLTFIPDKGPQVSFTLSGTGTSSQAQPAVISTQPGSQTVTAGQTATFNVAATGTAPMAYQWKKNGASISGATSSSYTTSATTTSDNNAQFTVAVSNSAGSANSNSATLTVDPAVVAPSITTQPASRTVIAGQTATFNVAASGTAPMTYQWKKNGASISGATSSSYTTSATTTSDNNAQFTVAVSNSAGSVTSNPATLTVSASTLLLNSSSTSLSFGNVNVSSSSSKNVTLTNAGTSNITISNVTISGAGFNASGVSTGLILTPGQSTTLTATFTPSSTGSITGSVAVASNATNSPDTIALSGTGVNVVNHSVALSWLPSTSTVVGYNVYSSTQTGGPYTKLNSTPVTTTVYTDSTVKSGLTYYYVVTAVDASNTESVYSSEISATIP